MSPAASAGKRVDDMLDRVGLAARPTGCPPQLSGGQQQRVALARALVFKPRALLLDEPLSALDAAPRVGMRDEIRRLQREHAIATLYITHDQEEALSMADRVAVMRDGRLVQVGLAEELYERPADASVAGFVGHANLWQGRVRDAATVDTPLGPLRLASGHGFSPGAAATVMVRPEACRPWAAPDGVNQFTGRLLRDRFLGSLRRYDFDTDRGAIAGETPMSNARCGAHSARRGAPASASQSRADVNSSLKERVMNAMRRCMLGASWRCCRSQPARRR